MSSSADGRRLIAIKVGGGLTAFPGALDRVSHGLASLAEQYRILVLPGGGPFADAVRAFQQERGLGRQDGSQRARNRCSYRYLFRVCCVVGMGVERNGWG